MSTAKNIIIIFCILVLIIKLCNIYIFKKRINRIIKNININDKILDFGCGSCCYTKYLKDLGYNITGIDVINEGTCFKPNIYNGKKIPYNDNYFDVVICSFVLHHIPDYKKIIKELIRVTKKFILIYEDTPISNIDYFFTKIHSLSSWGSCHKCFNTTEEWKKIFYNNSLNIIKYEKISRYECPFAQKPLFYPVPSTFFVLQVNK